MSIVFLSIEDKMLQMACAALLGAANGMTLERFNHTQPMPYPSAENLCIVITAMMKALAEGLPEKDRAICILTHMLEQAVMNLKAVEGPKRV